LEKFDVDLERLFRSLTSDLDEIPTLRIQTLKDRLVHLLNLKLVKINHSIMELLCAKSMVLEGYEVELERSLNNDLTCDIYGQKGEGTISVEVETGFVPPDHALDPASYGLTRVASKIARYSHYAEKFALGAPPYHVLQILKLFLKPPRDRQSEGISRIKELCDQYYTSPRISIDDIRKARIHAIYMIDVDGNNVSQVDHEDYLQRIMSRNYARP
jgi:hypothetical protein